MSERAFYLVCYDIDDDRDRRWAAGILLEYGRRVQESVFECHLAARDIDTLLEKIQGRLDSSTDEVGFYKLCLDCRSATRTLSGRKPEGLRRYRVV